MDAATVPFRHLLIAVAVAFVWGTNFVVIRIGLDTLPPLLFAALRFTFAALPAILFLPRPKVSLGNLAAYGLLIGVGQFGILFIALRADISPGLASLVVQTQIFFTIGLSIWLNGERVRSFQWIALALGLTGLALIAANTGGTTTPLGLALVLFAALSWAGGNMVAKANGGANMLHYVVWASVFSAPPLFALSFLVEGWPAISAGLAAATPVTWGAVIWQATGNVMFGYAAWGWLLARHPAATITPVALLVPIFGLAASAYWLGEPMPLWKLLATGLVIAGLVVGIFWPRLRRTARPSG